MLRESLKLTKDAIGAYTTAIVNDYADYIIEGFDETSDDVKDWHKKRVREFRNSVNVTFGKKYAKVITGHSVHSFVVLFGCNGFKTGDILMAASSSSPAINFARGNIFNLANANFRWSGACGRPEQKCNIQYRPRRVEVNRLVKV